MKKHRHANYYGIFSFPKTFMTLTLQTGLLGGIPFGSLNAAEAPSTLQSTCCTTHFPDSKSSGYCTIVKTDSIVVLSPAGTVPSLPYRIMVTYSDGKTEFRQVRWSNTSPATESQQANPQIYPAGKHYRIKGYITGDNTTPNGYLVYADVKVTQASPTAPSYTPIAHTLPLDKVRINGHNRLTSNRDLAINEIISWDVTQQLYNYRDTYGLSTEGYTVSDGWDSPTTKLKGHGSGHYMSALALAYACCEDKEKKAILYKNIARMVNELRECQERTFVWNKELGRYWEARDFAPEEELCEMKGTWEAFDQYKTQYAQYGYGYLNAIPAQHAALIEMYRAYNNSDWVWAPYYSIHKQLAGLIDIATYMDDKEIADKALLIAKDMGLWVWNRMHYRTYCQTDGTQEQRRAKPGNRYEMWNMYIAGEVGGISESLARLAEMTKNKDEKAKLLEASNYFDSPAFYDPLSRNIDAIRTRHANQHIPMIIGALRSYLGNHNPYYYHIAQNFWDMIQGRYRYATGGVGNGEMFRQPYSQILSMATNVTSDSERNLYPSPNINETCCAYNLAKLTKDLNCLNPDNAEYMDYYERVLYNQLVGSLHPTHYMTTYHYAVGLNASKPWGNETPQSSCCGGTGSENHVKYQEAAYFVSDETIWIALYMPTTARWDEKKVTIEQDCLWPAEKSTIKITNGSAKFAMKLRVPYWATEGFDIKLNGQSIAANYQPSSYVTIPARKWKKTDIVEVIMPFTRHIDFGPDKMETAATAKNETQTAFKPMWAGTIMYGPLAMTATGLTNWDEATIDLKSDLSDLIPNGATQGDGYKANVYSLSLNGQTLLPDYYTDQHSTHYFRINLLGDPSAENKQRLSKHINMAKAYTPTHYTESSFTSLDKAIITATDLCQGHTLSNMQVDENIAILDKAIAALKPKGETDLSILTQTLKEAKNQNGELFTTQSYENLQKEINAAEILLSSSSAQTTVDLQVYRLNRAIQSLAAMTDIDHSQLDELLQLAASRKKAQEAWLALEVKVPEFAPWAPHGYARLMTQYEEALKVRHNTDRRYNQEETDKTAAALNASINTMRPGNLAEPEDLNQLLQLVEKAKSLSEGKDSHPYQPAIDYAEMVIKYVNDGSGTLDMIRDAESRMKKVME